MMQQSDDNLFDDIGDDSSTLKELLLKGQLLPQTNANLQIIKFKKLDDAKSFTAKLLEIGMGNRRMLHAPKKVDPIFDESNNDLNDYYTVELTVEEFEFIQAFKEDKQEIQFDLPLATFNLVEEDKEELSPESSSQVWSVNTGHHPFKLVDGKWKQMPGANIKTIAVGPNGDVWALNTANNIFKFDPETESWALVATNGTSIVVAAGWEKDMIAKIISEIKALKHWNRNVPQIMRDTQLVLAENKKLKKINQRMQQQITDQILQRDRNSISSLIARNSKSTLRMIQQNQINLSFVVVSLAIYCLYKGFKENRYDIELVGLLLFLTGVFSLSHKATTIVNEIILKIGKSLDKLDGLVTNVASAVNLLKDDARNVRVSIEETLADGRKAIKEFEDTGKKVSQAIQDGIDGGKFQPQAVVTINATADTALLRIR